MGIFGKILLQFCLSLLICHLCLCDDDEIDVHDAPFGGVSIKVFRGPSKVKGKDIFAPFGYYVKMPADSTAYNKKDDSKEDADDASVEGNAAEDSIENDAVDGSLEDNPGEF